MSFMDIFKSFSQGAGGPAAGAGNPSPTPNNPGGPAANPTVPSASTINSDGSVAAIPAAATGDQSPLANYADLWAKPDPSKPAPTAPTLVPNMQVDASKIMEAARGMNFSQGLDPALLARLEKGNDPEAVQLMVNAVAQNAYAQSAMATTRIVQSAMQLQEKNFNETVMPSVLRKFAVSSAVAENPISNDPAAAPLLQALESQLSQRYKEATPAEIKKHASDYLTGFAQAVVRANGGIITNPADTLAANGNQMGMKAKEVDWEKFFDVEPLSASGSA
jgi:hypothetical protein